MAKRDNLVITLGQTDLTWENPEQNRRELESKIMGLIGKSDLVILPETFTTGFSMRSEDLAETMDGATVKWMHYLSETSGLAIGGSLLIRDNGLYFNRFIFVTPSGAISFYDKRHLFSIGGESSFLNAGNQRVIVRYMGWKIALYVCYDIRFPVWCRNLNDTDLMIFTANWPDSRREVWNILLKARAIENQVYVAGINRIGTDGNSISYAGDSNVIDAKGEAVLPTFRNGHNWQSYILSKKDLNDFRIKFPVTNDADRFSLI